MRVVQRSQRSATQLVASLPLGASTREQFFDALSSARFSYSRLLFSLLIVAEVIAVGFHAVAANLHVAPATGVILAGVEEQLAAGRGGTAANPGGVL